MVAAKIELEHVFIVRGTERRIKIKKKIPYVANNRVLETIDKNRIIIVHLEVILIAGIEVNIYILVKIINSTIKRNS